MRDQSARNDRIVWGLAEGRALYAMQTLQMEDAGDDPPVFTEGRAYRVISVHAIASPAYVKVVDDQGHDHCLHGEHIRAWFSLTPPVSGCEGDDEM